MPNPPSTRIAQLPRGVVAHLRSDAVDRQVSGCTCLVPEERLIALVTLTELRHD